MSTPYGRIPTRNTNTQPQPVLVANATLYAVVNTGAGANSMVTLFPGPNQIGSVTIANNPTLGAGTNYIGLATVNIGSSNATLYAVVNTAGVITATIGNVTLNPGPNQIGSVTIANNPSLGPSSDFIGLISVASINGQVSLIGTPTVLIGTPTLFAVVNTGAISSGNVTLNPGPNQIGSVTIANNPTLGVGTNYIGLASVNIGGSLPALTAGSAFIGLVSTASINGTVTISGALPTGTNFIGLATVVIGGGGASDGRILDPTSSFYLTVTSLASGNAAATQIKGLTGNTVDVDSLGNQLVKVNSALPTGSNFIGLVSLASINGQVTLTNTGLVSNASVASSFVDTILLGQYGADAKTSLTSGSFHPLQSDNSGYLMLGTNTRYIGLASVNIGGSLPALTAGSAFIGLVSTASITGIVSVSGAIPAGSNFVGLVSVASITGQVQVVAGTGYIGLASVNIGGTLPALTTGSAYVGLASVNIGGTLPALSAGTNFIGLVSLASITGQISVTDETSTVNIIASDSGQNAFPILGARKEITFATTSVAAVASTDVSNYRWVSVQITSQGTGSSVIYQGSNDNSNWKNVLLGDPTSINNFSSSSGNATELRSGPLNYRYFRLNVTGISGGTTAGYVEFFNNSYGLGPTTVSANQSGTWSVNASVASITGQITVTNTGLVSNASVATNFLNDMILGQYGGDGKTSLASGSFHPLQVDNSGYLMLGTNTKYVGLASVNIGGSLPALTVGSAFIGLISAASINGTVTLSGAVPAGSNYIGLMSLASINGTVTNAVGSNFIGLVSTASINGTVTNAAGSNFIGLVSVASITGSVGLAAGSNFVGLISVASIMGVVSLTPNTNSGWTPYAFFSLTSGVQQVKSSAAELGGYYVYNPNSSVVYLQLLDIGSSSVSLGVRAPTLSFGIPALGAANLEYANGVNFATAIQVAATTTPNGSTGPTTPIPVNIIYK